VEMITEKKVYNYLFTKDTKKNRLPSNEFI